MHSFLQTVTAVHRRYRRSSVRPPRTLSLSNRSVNTVSPHKTPSNRARQCTKPHRTSLLNPRLRRAGVSRSRSGEFLPNAHSGQPRAVCSTTYQCHVIARQDSGKPVTADYLWVHVVPRGLRMLLEISIPGSRVRSRTSLSSLYRPIRRNAYCILCPVAPHCDAEENHIALRAKASTSSARSITFISQDSVRRLRTIGHRPPATFRLSMTRLLRPVHHAAFIPGGPIVWRKQHGLRRTCATASRLASGMVDFVDTRLPPRSLP